MTGAITLRGTPADFSKFLRSFGKNIPPSVEDKCVDGARRIAAKAAELSPVDLGELRGKWRVIKVRGGVDVANAAPSAEFIERGRGPGPVPFAPIREWVARHAGDFGVTKLAKRGSKKRNVQDAALDSAAWAVKRSIEAKGYAPRFPLRRAIESEGAAISKSILNGIHAAAVKSS